MYNLIEDYLDRVSLPLVRRLPYHERQRIRQEMRDHLLERVNELKAQGVSDDEAVAVAIRQFGSPEWVGTLILEKHTSLPRLNWWRAVVLLLVVVVGSFALVMANHRIEDDMRQPQVVDVVLWTIGSKALQADPSPLLRTALDDLQHLPLYNRPLPPLAQLRAVQEPSLRPLAEMVQERYSRWYSQVSQNKWGRPPGGPEGWMYGAGMVRVPFTVPDSVCVSWGGGCESRKEMLPNGVVALQVAATMLACAAIAGLLMHQRRWVAGAAIAVVLLSPVWCAGVALNFSETQMHSRDYLLAQIVRSAESVATQQPRLVQSSPPRLPLATMELKDNAQRLQRIQQLVQLYHVYEADHH
ncbi:MAG: permease prefix domain 1-containing protein, partial [Armatimonadota bacterium]